MSGLDPDGDWDLLLNQADAAGKNATAAATAPAAAAGGGGGGRAAGGGSGGGRAAGGAATKPAAGGGSGGVPKDASAPSSSSSTKSTSATSSSSSLSDSSAPPLSASPYRLIGGSQSHDPSDPPQNDLFQRERQQRNKEDKKQNVRFTSSGIGFGSGFADQPADPADPPVYPPQNDQDSLYNPFSSASSSSSSALSSSVAASSSSAASAPNQGVDLNNIIKIITNSEKENDLKDFEQLRSKLWPPDYYKRQAIVGWNKICDIVQRLNLPVNLKRDRSPVRKTFIDVLNGWENWGPVLLESITASPPDPDSLVWDWESKLADQIPTIQRLGLDLNGIQDYGDFVSVFLAFCEEFDTKVQNIKSMKAPIQAQAQTQAQARNNSRAQAQMQAQMQDHARTQARQLMKELNLFMTQIQTMIDFIPVLTARLLSRTGHDLQCFTDTTEMEGNIVSLRKNWQRFVNRMAFSNDRDTAKGTTSQDFEIYFGLNYIRHSDTFKQARLAERKTTPHNAPAFSLDKALEFKDLDNLAGRTMLYSLSLAGQHLMKFLDGFECVDVADEKEVKDYKDKTDFEGVGNMIGKIHKFIKKTRNPKGKAPKFDPVLSSPKDLDDDKFIDVIQGFKQNVINKATDISTNGTNLQKLILKLAETALVRILPTCAVISNLSETELLVGFEHVFQVLLKIYFLLPMVQTGVAVGTGTGAATKTSQQTLGADPLDKESKYEAGTLSRPQPSGASSRKTSSGASVQPSVQPARPLLEVDLNFEILQEFIDCTDRNVPPEPVSATAAEKIFIDLLLNSTLEWLQYSSAKLETTSVSSTVSADDISEALLAEHFMLPLHRVEPLHWFKELSFPAEVKSINASGSSGNSGNSGNTSVKKMLQNNGINDWNKYLNLKGIQGPMSNGSSNGSSTNGAGAGAAKTAASASNKSITLAVTGAGVDRMKLSMESAMAENMKKLNANLQDFVSKYAKKVEDPNGTDPPKYNFFIPARKVHDCLSKLVGALGGQDFFSLEYIQTWTMEDLLLLACSWQELLVIKEAVEDKTNTKVTAGAQLALITRLEMYSPVILKFINLLDNPNLTCNIMFYISFLIKRAKDLGVLFFLNYMLVLNPDKFKKGWREKWSTYLLLTQMTPLMKHVAKKFFEDLMVAVKIFKKDVQAKALKDAKDKKEQEELARLGIATGATGSSGGSGRRVSGASGSRSSTERKGLELTGQLNEDEEEGSVVQPSRQSDAGVSTDPSDPSASAFAGGGGGGGGDADGGGGGSGDVDD